MKKYKLKKILIKSKKQKGSNDNCPSFPDLPSIVNCDRSKINRIIGIGDIHGDLDLAVNCLTVAKVIKQVANKNKESIELKFKRKDSEEIRYYQWIGEKTIVVQVGDQVDRCRPLSNDCTDINQTFNDEASDLEILFFFHKLHLMALKVDCAVYSLLGNHEILNVLGNMKYVSYLGLKQFQEENHTDLLADRIEAFKLKSNKLIFENKINLSTFLACSRQSAIIIDGYLFVHAGILDKLIKTTAEHSDTKINNIDSIDIINRTVQSWLLGSINKEDDIEYVNKLLSGNISPFWPRIFGNLEPKLPMENPACQKNVKPILETLNLKGIIVGHTPQLKININSTCDNTVWRIDVAGSQAFQNVIYSANNTVKTNKIIEIGRKPQVLEIILNKNKDKNDEFNLLIHEN